MKRFTKLTLVLLTMSLGALWTGPAPAVPTPPVPVSILSITATGGATVIVAFSGPVLVDTGVGPPDAALEVEGGRVPAAVATLDANRVTVEFTGDVAAGQEWTLSAQPNWLITPVAGTMPQSGFIAA